MLVILFIAFSLITGKSRMGDDIEDSIFEHFGPVTTVKKIAEDFYYLYDTKSMFEKPVSILAIASAEGYSGPIRVGVNYDLQGNILVVKVLSQTETPGFFRRIVQGKYVEQYTGKNIQEKLILKENIDAVSGATVTCVGIHTAVQKANDASCQLHFKNRLKRHLILPGLKDLLIIFLYLGAIVFSFSKSKRLKKFLPLFHLISVVFLGFVYKGLLSITHFNNLLLGNFPDNQYYWWLVIGFFVLTIFLSGKNLYFATICPMGIIQDYLFKFFPVSLKFKYRKVYQIPAIVGTLAILGYAMIANQPGFFGYEIFSTVFQFDFTSCRIVVAIVSLMLAMVIKRFWCRFLCPVGLVGRFLMMVRSLILRK